MKLTEIGISVLRTFNLGNFESLRVEANATASVEGAPEIEAAKSELLAELRAALRQAYDEFKPTKG